MIEIICTAMDGTLQRKTDGRWYWSDGPIADGVGDVDRSGYYNFRISTISGASYVEVSRSLAENESDLGWIASRVHEGLYDVARSGDHIGPLVWDGESLQRSGIVAGDDPLGGVGEPFMDAERIPAVVLVPAEDWRDWEETAVPLGPWWDSCFHQEIEGKARTLGWNPGCAPRWVEDINA